MWLYRELLREWFTLSPDIVFHQQHPNRELRSQPCGLVESHSAQHLAVGERQISHALFPVWPLVGHTYYWVTCGLKEAPCQLHSPLHSRQGLLALLMLWCQRGLEDAQLFQKWALSGWAFCSAEIGEWYSSSLRHEEKTFIVYNAYRFISRGSGLALWRFWHLRGLQERCLPQGWWLWRQCKSMAAAKHFLLQKAFTKYPVRMTMSTLLLQWPAESKLTFDTCCTSRGWYKPNW